MGKKMIELALDNFLQKDKDLLIQRIMTALDHDSSLAEFIFEGFIEITDEIREKIRQKLLGEMACPDQLIEIKEMTPKFGYSYDQVISVVYMVRMYVDNTGNENTASYVKDQTHQYEKVIEKTSTIYKNQL